jgi:aldehyde dehydrogenase (NAD+)
MSLGPAPESSAPVKQWLDSHQRRFGLYINGTWTRPSDESHFASINPADGSTLAQITQASDSDVDASVRAARMAYAEWHKTSGHVRARFLYAIARQIQKHARLFAVLESMDNGKPIRESRDIDIPLVIRHFYHHAGWAQIADREFAGYQSVGVCAQIIPWNFPLLMLAWKIAPALAAGNTVVLKPAEWTPLTALLFGEICSAVGLPSGVVNIITGDGRTGAALAAHADVDKVAFTGSTEVGRILRKATADTPKKLSLELGGKSPMIIDATADLELSARKLVWGKCFNAGQTCIAPDYVLIEASVHDRFVEMVKAELNERITTSGDIASIINRTHHARLQGLIDDAVKHGATAHPWAEQAGSTGHGHVLRSEFLSRPGRTSGGTSARCTRHPSAARPAASGRDRGWRGR